MPDSEIVLAATEILRLSADRHLLLLLDFDGTLCEFNPDPEAVFLSDARREILMALHDRDDTTVAIVSGRRLEDVRARAGLPADNYHAGLHGLQIEGQGQRFEHPEARKTLDIVRALIAGLRDDLQPLKGTFVEDKTLSAVVHFREASAGDAERIPGIVQSRAGRHLSAGHLRIMPGSYMIELLPNIEWDKGHAVAWIRERVQATAGVSLASVYIGDDRTDEDAFRVVRGEGVAVASSPRAAGADFELDGPVEVEELLRRIAERRGSEAARSGLPGAGARNGAFKPEAGQ